MKRVSLYAACIASAFVFTAGAASAQDWTGFYAGAQAGYAWGEADQPWSFTHGGALDQPQDSPDLDGGLLGLHAGFNWEVGGGWVLGVEGDYEWTDQQGDDGGSGGDVNGVEINSQGSIRARAGYLFTPDLLGYATAGWTRMDVDATAPGTTVDGHIDGWVAGVGVEVAIDPNWSATVEYRHSDMNQERFSFAPSHVYDEGIEPQVDALRVGFNYRFHM